MMAATKTVCHVSGCSNEAVSAEWFPQLGCVLCFCRPHQDTPEPDRADWIIELARARSEHEDAIEALLAASSGDKNA